MEIISSTKASDTEFSLTNSKELICGDAQGRGSNRISTNISIPKIFAGQQRDSQSRRFDDQAVTTSYWLPTSSIIHSVGVSSVQGPV